MSQHPVELLALCEELEITPDEVRELCTEEAIREFCETVRRLRERCARIEAYNKERFSFFESISAQLHEKYPKQAEQKTIEILKHSYDPPSLDEVRRILSKVPRDQLYVESPTGRIPREDRQAMQQSWSMQRFSQQVTEAVRTAKASHDPILVDEPDAIEHRLTFTLENPANFKPQ